VREAALASGRPLAVHGGTPRLPLPPAATVISIDNRAAATEIGAAAFAGSRRPAVVSFPLQPGQAPGIEWGVDIDVVSMCNTRERLLGFRSALEAAGHRWEDVPVAVVARNDRLGSRPLIDTLLGAGVDAVAAMSDELALATLDALAGRAVPGEVAVTGWDDSPAAEAAGLTTIHQSLHDQGVCCGRWVVGDGTGPVDAPAWELVMRRSTGSRSA
jgi:DNA-binding LacI/PurR family transcriptional regulator